MKPSILILAFLGCTSWINSQLLYEIKSKDGQKSSYIFGTIHMMPKEQFAIQPNLQNAFNQTTTLAMEVDLNMDLATKIDLAKQTFLPDGKTLEDITSKEQYQAIYSYCIDSNGISKKKFKRYSHLKPFFFSSVLLQDELKETKSYELEFNDMASKAGKKTMGLESIQVQMQTINSVSIQDQVSMLMDGLKSTETYDAMLTNYLNENLDLLYHDIIVESNSFPNFVENFLNKRNKNWIPVIENQIEHERTFIAVGAGHLPGENGVLNLLKMRGYTLTAIPLK